MLTFHTVTNRTDGLITPEYHDFYLASNGRIPFRTLGFTVNDIDGNTGLAYMNHPLFFLDKLKRNLEDIKAIEKNEEIAGRPILGKSAGPYPDQPPLVFDCRYQGYLQDMSFTHPFVYKNMLDQYILSNYSRLTKMPAISYSQITDELRAIFKKWLWVLSIRSKLLGGQVSLYPYFEGAITIQEIAMVDAIIDHNNKVHKKWKDIVSRWVSEAIKFSNQEKWNRWLENYNTLVTKDELVLKVVVPWYEENKHIIKKDNDVYSDLDQVVGKNIF